MDDIWDPPPQDPLWQALDYALNTGSELLGDEGDDLVLSVNMIETGAVLGCDLYGLESDRAVAWVTARALREMAVSVLCSSSCPDGARALLVDLAGETLSRRRQSDIAAAAAANSRSARGPSATHAPAAGRRRTTMRRS